MENRKRRIPLEGDAGSGNGVDAWRRGRRRSLKWKCHWRKVKVINGICPSDRMNLMVARPCRPKHRGSEQWNTRTYNRWKGGFEGGGGGNSGGWKASFCRFDSLSWKLSITLMMYIVSLLIGSFFNCIMLHDIPLEVVHICQDLCQYNILLYTVSLRWYQEVYLL